MTIVINATHLYLLCSCKRCFHWVYTWLLHCISVITGKLLIPVMTKEQCAVCFNTDLTKREKWKFLTMLALWYSMFQVNMLWRSSSLSISDLASFDTLGHNRLFEINILIWVGVNLIQLGTNVNVTTQDKYQVLVNLPTFNPDHCCKQIEPTSH